MITLLTGLPGNGKTLYALWFIKRYQESENKRLAADSAKSGAALIVRQVFYAGISDLTLPWTQIEATDWPSCPPGSIIVIDEAQNTFSKKPNGASLPAHYEKLATHRHHGFDIFVITQHPSLVDNFLRKLVGRHFHAVRKFGMQRASIYEWSAANNNPETPASQKSSIPLKWTYPKEVYSYYKSAEVHTVKRAIPLKLIAGVLFVILMVVFFWFALDSYQARGRQMKEAAGIVDSSASPAGGARSSFSSSPGAVIDPMEDAKNFAFSQTPRVAGVAHTAPKYDQLTKPSRVPVPAMCIRRGDFCRCFSQQGTSLQVPTNMCLEISQNGYFREFDPEGPMNAPIDQQALPPVDRSPSYQVASAAPAVAVMPYTPEVSRYNGSPSK